ncbi:hypothetical protein [Amycolatopsis sp. NPDC051061]|uniref:hypothetical protein n=1 Tax=Amycolatopsis sp. NPDC051061 TaxID=3155042 RepID=UPI0034126DEC
MARDDDRSVEEFSDHHPDRVVAVDALRSALEPAESDMVTGRAGYEVAWDLGNSSGRPSGEPLP